MQLFRKLIFPRTSLLLVSEQWTLFCNLSFSCLPLKLTALWNGTSTFLPSLLRFIGYPLPRDIAGPQYVNLQLYTRSDCIMLILVIWVPLNLSQPLLERRMSSLIRFLHTFWRICGGTLNSFSLYNLSSSSSLLFIFPSSPNFFIIFNSWVRICLVWDFLI